MTPLYMPLENCLLTGVFGGISAEHVLVSCCNDTYARVESRYKFGEAVQD